MGFIEDAAEAALALTMDRIRRNADHGLDAQQPAVDAKQQGEFLEEQRQGGTDEPYRQCLEYHGFVFVPAPLLEPYDGYVGHAEGEWRSNRLGLAFTTSDLPMAFPGGPEDLDRYLRQHQTAARMRRGRVAKSEVRRMLSRR